MQLALDGRPIDELAIDVIREFAQHEPYCLAYSGGKDSTVLLDLAERSGVNFVARNQWINGYGILQPQKRHGRGGFR